MRCIWISSYHKLKILPPKRGTHPTLDLVIVKFQTIDDNNLSTQGKPSFSVTCTLVPVGEDSMYSHNPDTMEFMHPRWSCLSPRGPNLVACMNTIMLIEYFVEETTKGTTHISAFLSLKNYILIHFASFKNRWTRWKNKKLFLTHLSMVLLFTCICTKTSCEVSRGFT
jgi:hypothetical protein